MKILIILLLIGGFIFIAFKGFNKFINLSPVTPSPSPSISPTPFSEEKLSKQECLAKGGTWQKWGLAQNEFCQIPAPDAGKACSDGSQCSLGSCISETDVPDKPGECQTYKNIFGCFSFLKDGKPQQSVCID